MLREAGYLRNSEPKEQYGVSSLDVGEANKQKYQRA